AGRPVAGRQAGAEGVRGGCGVRQEVGVRARLQAGDRHAQRRHPGPGGRGQSGRGRGVGDPVRRRGHPRRLTVATRTPTAVGPERPTAVTDPAPRRRRRRRGRLHGHQALAGWLFVAPALLGLGLFLLAPILLALWVSFRDWSGLAPLDTATPVGAENYRDLLLDPGVIRTDFAKSLRNNLYYVLGVVPAQTMLAFVLAVIVNNQMLRGKAFFRTAFYFPSVTSSIAVSFIFVFLFSPSGVVNVLLSALLPGSVRTAWLNEAG